MTWATFDDNFADHPKVTALSDGAFRLHTTAILYCNRYLTDGFVPAGQVSRLTPNYSTGHLRELLAAGMWHAVGDAYEIYDFLQWNRSRAQVLAARKAKSEGGRRGAAKRWNA